MFLYDAASSRPIRVLVINKSLISNLAALLVVFAGLALTEPYRLYVLNTGLFALSGGITNWLAVHMLFERVPGFYGSGVIPMRFEEFKLGIRELIMEQFFKQADLESFFHGSGDTSSKINDKLASVINELNLDDAFESLIDVIMASSFGNMLGMLGGRDALNPLKSPFVDKMRAYLEEQLLASGLQQHIQDALTSALDEEAIRSKLEDTIDHRLNEMTPQMVKEIIQAMIHKHLGWLVVWGCVLGGTIGLAVTAISNL